MKYIDAELLQKEIERQIMGIIKKQDANPDMPKYRWYLYEGMKEAFNDIGDFIDALPDEPVTDCHDLTEAAENKYPTRWKKYPNDGIVRSEEYFDLNAEKRDAFKAGAEWQYQKDRGEFAKIKAKTWCEGFDACKAKMMEGAVEGVVNHGTAVSYVISDEDQLDKRLKQFQNDAKVRIIILPEEEDND